MAVTGSIGMFGDKVIIGALDVSFLDASSRLFPGTLVCNGPAYFGANGTVGAPRATVMIGPPLGISVPASLEVIGIANIIGVFNVTAVSTFTGLTTKLGTTIKNALSLKNGVDIANALKVGNSVKVQNGADNVNGVLNVAGVINCAWLDGKIAAAMLAPGKGFDMHHPTKKGWRLAHACIEGPEVGVYHRGKSESNVIQIPEYWKGLVHEDSITVNLTPIGENQNLYVESVDYNGGVINIGGGIHFNYYYTIFGERKDLEKLYVEYEGKIEDYPGDNSQRSIVGYNYDYRKGVNG
tara:strand:+ start:5525 stop:6409 length:885 start_codon:yes stop_codon:yes gene_type:complete